MSKQNNITAHIDFDIICYSCAAVAEKVYYTIPGTPIHHQYKRDAIQYCKDNDINPVSIVKCVQCMEVSYALHAAKKLINKCLKSTGARQCIGYLTGTDNFRCDVAVDYKANRTQVKPTYYSDVKQYLLDNYTVIVANGQEADDAMAQAQWPHVLDGTSVICTIDKDLDMIPGKHYNWKKDATYDVSFAEALTFFYRQMLTGDSVDNIQGVKGIGIKRAEKLLEGAVSEFDLYQRVQEAYINEAEKALEGALSQYIYDQAMSKLRTAAQLLWIRREKDVEWVPPTEREIYAE
jgi:hypothetical protein